MGSRTFPAKGLSKVLRMGGIDDRGVDTGNGHAESAGVAGRRTGLRMWSALGPRRGGAEGGLHVELSVRCRNHLGLRAVLRGVPGTRQQGGVARTRTGRARAGP